MNQKSIIYQSFKSAADFLSLVGHAVAISEGLRLVTHYIGWLIHHTSVFTF